jgi:hypothetical protein
VEKISKFVSCVQKAAVAVAAAAGAAAAAGSTFMVASLHPVKSLMLHLILEMTY